MVDRHPVLTNIIYVGLRLGWCCLSQVNRDLSPHSLLLCHNRLLLALGLINILFFVEEYLIHSLPSLIFFYSQPCNRVMFSKSQFITCLHHKIIDVDLFEEACV